MRISRETQGSHIIKQHRALPASVDGVYLGSSRELAVRSVGFSIFTSDVLHVADRRDLADAISKEPFLFEFPQHLQQAAHRTG